jgi:hypothetical protein
MVITAMVVGRNEGLKLGHDSLRTMANKVLEKCLKRECINTGSKGARGQAKAR